MIISARYTNPEKSAAVAVTDDLGAILISQQDSPEQWAALHAWGAPEPFVAVSDVPTSVTPLQARKALRQAGLKAQVDAYIATLSDEAQEEWEYCIAVERNNGLVSDAATALGMTEEQKDDLFRLAATL